MASARVKREIAAARRRGRLARKVYVNRLDKGKCQVWTGYVKPCDSGQGWYEYGIVSRKLAHRVFWELANGPIPVGRRLYNVCGNTRCVKPAHWKLRVPLNAS
jgi:hypothetical protein